MRNGDLSDRIYLQLPGLNPNPCCRLKKRISAKILGSEFSGGGLRSAFVVQCGLPLDRELCHPSLQ